MSETRVWRTTFPRLSQFAREHLLLLPFGALIALVWVNTAPESYYRLTYAVSFAVNDVAMTLFFALMTKEVVEATAPGGVLHPWRRAIVPVIAAVGAAVVPALIHLRVVEALEEPVLAAGWPVSLATDLAMSYFVARLIFRQHAVIAFLLLLGIASDALGFLALALFDPVGDLRLVSGALLLAVAIGVAAGLRRWRVKAFWPYLLVSGGLSWYAFFSSGVHPALALVPIMPFLPHAARDPGFFVDAPPDARDTLNQFEIWWRYPAQVALFFFGLVNAGVPDWRPRAGHMGAADCRHRREAAGGAHRERCRHARWPASATARRMAGAHRDRAHGRDGIYCRAVFLRRAPAPGPIAL